ncbi:lipoate--protein ligase [Enterococcus sp. BWM-S5]|uniref:lipoate--protein ligase n=1 Tax=Enterococcus larvae TaxID=2794352 RepID=A0ABS4CIR9_9ENTE|nr:lipoate--protein ligase [Enterococcus larvae]MBP1046515.1 lipoate--protein ligase [Enterococcus larvae]
MYYVLLESRDIRENLAAEQYILNQLSFDEPLVLFYIQKPCVIIGRNQNAYAEINMTYAKEKHITITRRQSGGGAVYDDLGNVSFSFVMEAANRSFGDFRTLTQPILTALHRMGAVGAEMNGRNDLYLDGQKFSGNAMYKKGKKMYMHGTLMFDVDLEEMSKVLNVSKIKIESKGTKSVRSHVTNLKPYLSRKYQDISIEDFRDQLLLQLFEASDLEEIRGKRYELTTADYREIAKLVKEIYGNKEWIYGEAPEFTIHRERKFGGGLVEVGLSIEKGRIHQIKIYGDYFSQKDTKEIEALLTGCVYDQPAIKEALAAINFDEYFTNISREEFICLLTDR